MSKYAESEEAFVRVREEYFTTFNDGKEECLCRIILPFAEGDPLSKILDELYDRVQGACESGELVRRYEKDRENRERFSVIPYRYLCRGTLYRIDDTIVSCRIDASLDARFPGGVHLSRTYGFLYDEQMGMIISVESLMPLDIRRDLKKKGKICASYADDNGIHLILSDKSECLYPTERLVRSYQDVKRCVLSIRKKRKKVLTKEGNCDKILM